MPMSFLQFSDKVLRNPVTIMVVCHVHPAELSLEDFVLKESTRAAQNHTTAGTQFFVIRVLLLFIKMGKLELIS